MGCTKDRSNREASSLTSTPAYWPTHRFFTGRLMPDPLVSLEAIGDDSGEPRCGPVNYEAAQVQNSAFRKCSSTMVIGLRSIRCELSWAAPLEPEIEEEVGWRGCIRDFGFALRVIAIDGRGGFQGVWRARSDRSSCHGNAYS